MRPQLIAISGPDQGRVFSLEEGQTLVIGRGGDGGRVHVPEALRRAW
jgi:hypothetical protein